MACREQLPSAHSTSYGQAHATNLREPVASVQSEPVHLDDGPPACSPALRPHAAPDSRQFA